MKNSKASLLTSDHKRNLFILLVIPVVVFLLWGQMPGRATRHVDGLQGSQSLAQAQQTVINNSDIYGLLEKATPNYTPVDIMEGLEKGKLVGYFSPRPLPPEYTGPRGGGGPSPAPEPVEIPEVWPTSVTLIYKGQNMNYAIVDGVLLKEGDPTPDGLILSAIENNRVLIKGKRSERWITLEF